LPVDDVAPRAVPSVLGDAPWAAPLVTDAPEGCSQLLLAQDPARGWFEGRPASVSAARDEVGTWVLRHAVLAGQDGAEGAFREAVEGCRAAPPEGLAVVDLEIAGALAVAV